jgi:hypothetical protein
MPVQDPWDVIPFAPPATFITRLRGVFEKRKETMKRSSMRCWVGGPHQNAEFDFMVEQLSREVPWWQSKEGIRLAFIRNISTERFKRTEVRIYPV